MKENELFKSVPIKKALMKMSFPLMVSMLVTVIYNMADTFFIGQTGDANQVAAVSLTTPIFMLLMAIGNIFGSGGSSYISRTLGEKNQVKVKRISSFCFYSSIFLGFLSIVVLLGGIEPILKFLGTSSATNDYCRNYLFYYILGAPFVLCSFSLSNIIRSEGASKEAMIGNMIGTIANIILDPILILAFGMGVSGAAIATVIGNALAVLYFATYIIRRSTVLSISLKDLSIKDKIVSSVMSIGIPASVNNILMSISYIFVNNYLKAYGDSAIGAMGIANKVISLVTLLLVGFASGSQPLLGYSYGAKNHKRLNELLSFSFRTVIIGGTLGGLVIYIFSNSIIKLFINDVEIINYGTTMLRALILSTPIIGIIFVLNSLFQAMGKGTQSMILALSRQGLIFIPIIAIMSKSFGLDGVIYSQAITDLLTTLLSIAMFILVKKQQTTTLNTNLEFKNIA